MGAASQFALGSHWNPDLKIVVSVLTRSKKYDGDRNFAVEIFSCNSEEKNAEKYFEE